MDNGLRVRQILFESLLDEGDNRKNWEKLCCSRRPLVPFVGAGISAWCYPTWNNLLKSIVEKVYSPQGAEIVQEALACKNNPELEASVGTRDTFRWMEEIAECIFETNIDQYKRYEETFKPRQTTDRDENLVLKKLRRYVGSESNKKVEAVAALYSAFSDEKLRENGKIPEYQNLFCKLFQDVLVTTNYDKALESCYSSILSYSYKDLDKKGMGGHSWLFRAIMGKLDMSRQNLDGKKTLSPDVTVPGMPMLLKVHGSIERAEDIALSWSGYEQAYAGEMPELFRKIAGESTMIFLGCGMRDDRILAQLEGIGDGDLYAFLPKWDADQASGEAKQRELLERYNIYPIYYDRKLLEGLEPGDVGAEGSYHEFFLGLLLENLMRRRMFYPKALEELWDEDRFGTDESPDPETRNRRADGIEAILARQTRQIGQLYEKARDEWLMDGDPQYVHRRQAQEIWDLLNTSVECPMIAITGGVGTGKSFLCRSIQELHKSYKNTMRFFYISMDKCRCWEEFCTRLCEGLNIMITDVPEEQKWRELADRVSQRCGVYWRSVLILDQLEELQESNGDPRLWETIKTILRYWKENHTQVIFVCRSYQKGISCHTWQIEHLQKDEAQKVFFSACQSMRSKEMSGQEREAVSILFEKNAFQASEANLLGRYANSKSNLSSLLEEWNLYCRPGDEVGQTLAMILWNNLLAEHCYYDGDKDEDEKGKIKNNILWIWGILGKYPGSFPHQFFRSVLSGREKRDERERSYKTLIYMKNYGLCEEVVDRRQNNILENMIACVKDNFVSNLDKSLMDKFDRFIENFHGQGEGMVWFRGYFMHSYESSLRKYIAGFSEEQNSTGTIAESVRDILELLHTIGKQVKNSIVRAENAELDVILHYETKTIIQLLHACLMDEKPSEKTDTEQEPDERQITDDWEKLVLDIGSDFYTYYQYMPNYAYPFVRRLIERMERRKEHDGKKEEWDVSIAKLSKVMGDIQRLLGKKDDAIKSYQKAIRLCDDLMLMRFGDGSGGLDEILHIKAGVLLAINYYENSDRILEEAGSIYPQDDKAGRAYFNQRAAELKLDVYSRKKPPENTEMECFNEIKQYALESLRLFKEVELETENSQKEDNTKIAYILKLTGDLIVEFGKDTFTKDNTVIYNMDKARLEVRLDPEQQKEADEVETGWFYAAADFFLQAFMDYCGHINWRGLANVIQAMGTCIRARDKKKEKEERKDVENIYNMAEECFRWIGDVRGLADTLDYFGYYYVGIGGSDVTQENVMYKYMALGKWKESRRVWEQQGNSEKAGCINEKITELEEKLRVFGQKTQKVQREG